MQGYSSKVSTHTQNRTLIATQPLALIERVHLQSVYTLPPVPYYAEDILPDPEVALAKKRKLNWQEILADMTYEEMLRCFDEAEKRVDDHVDHNVQPRDPDVIPNVDHVAPLTPNVSDNATDNVQPRRTYVVKASDRAEDYLWDENEFELQEVEETVSQLDFELEL